MIRPVVSASVLELRREATRLLRDGGALNPERAREGQLDARRLGDAEALALWSRLRVRALRRGGAA